MALIYLNLKLLDKYNKKSEGVQIYLQLNDKGVQFIIM